jgi:Domain of unknown function (DUF4253)
MVRRSIIAGLLGFLSSFGKSGAQEQSPSRPDAGNAYEKNAIKELMAEEGITEDQIVRPTLDMRKLKYDSAKTKGDDALQNYENLKQDPSKIPLIVGGDDDLARIIEDMESQTESVEGYLQQADSLGLDFSIADYRNSTRDQEDQEDEEYAEFLKGIKGNWPNSGYALNAPTITADVASGQPLETVWLLRIPAKSSTEVPAYLKWGDWNDCPPAHVHVAMLRKWQRDYGAELVGMSGDVLNIRAKRRPGNKTQAMLLATEMYHYAPDIVLQGTETISALAASLMESDYWYFWWD